MLLFQTLVSSGTYVIAKVVTGVVDAFTLTLVRSLIAACAMLLLLTARGKWPSVRREDIPLILFLSALAVPANQFLFLYGMHSASASHAGLLYATTPILVLIVSRMFLHERLTHKKIIGVILGFAGVGVVFLDRGIDARYGLVTGDLFIAIAVVTWALYTVFGRRLIERYGAMTSTSMTLIVGSVMFLPIGIGPAVEYPFASLTVAAWMQIFYLGLMTSVVTYFLWYYALARIEAGRVALFSNLQPILTTILAVIFLGYTISGAFLVGGAIAIAGIIIAQFS